MNDEGLDAGGSGGGGADSVRIIVEDEGSEAVEDDEGSEAHLDLGWEDEFAQW